MDAVHAIAEPRRREILRLVWTDERSAGDIAERFDVTFGAVSQHLKVLREAGLVTLRQEGRRRYYRADREALGPLAPYLESMWSAKLDVLAELAEQVERAEQAEQAQQAKQAEQAGQVKPAEQAEQAEQAGQEKPTGPVEQPEQQAELTAQSELVNPADSADLVKKEPTT